MKWKLKSFDEIGFIGRGKSRHRPRNAEHLYGGIYPFIQTGDIKAAGFRINEYSQTYSEAGLAQSKLWKEGTLCITIAANIADTAILGIDACFPDSVIGFVPYENKSDVRFVKYFFDIFQARMKSIAVGAAQDNLSLEKLLTFKIPTPPLPIQRRIASILSAYDDLIENNLKRIKLLEEKAFLRYKGIVREEKMVSENKLEEIIQTVKRKPKVLKSDYKEKGEFPIIDQSTDFIGGYTNEKESVYEDVPMIVFGDHTRILKYINFPFACGADGTQLVKPENPNISIAYLYFELISCNLSNYHYARHFKFLKEQIIKLPSEKVMLEYKEETYNIFNLIQLFRLQNAKLREARDILLRWLMSGEIEL
ncbi:MAG: restriction endonuclease subunit S [Bacteroidota bacterium]|nr:restriction endonuclease subunit S [Bacteroidota bacterium]